MAILNVGTPNIDGRDYSILPDGVFRWTYQSTVETAGATAEAQFDLRFNSNQERTFQPYISIDRISVFTDGAPQSPPNALFYLVGNQWEDYPSSAYFDSIELRPTYSTNAYCGSLSSTPFYLGRAEGGTYATVSVILKEVLNATYRITASGTTSDFPILANEIWKT